MEIIYLAPGDILPYEHNPRKNKKAVDAVAASIKEFGFNSPVLIDGHNVIINGHTRWKAAKKLGLEKVPCIRAEGLTEEQIRAYRLIDNKTSEIASCDKDLLAAELDGLDFDALDFDFDFSADIKSGLWGAEKEEKRCNLEESKTARRCSGGLYLSCFDTGTEGPSLSEIKAPEYVQEFARKACDQIRDALGENLSRCSWCVCTTPRRRHGTGFHFATEIARAIAEKTGLPFYEGIIKCRSKHRVGAVFDLTEIPAESNVILYDDIITTGETLRASKAALAAAGKTVFLLVSIDNH